MHTAMRFISENYRVIKEYKNLAELLFAVFVSMLGFGLIMPLLPLYARDFGASGLELGILTSMFAATRVLTSYAGGHFIDKIGRKKVISFGLFVYAVDMFLFGTATELWHLYALRAVQGAASGVVWPAATVMAADIVRFEDRGKAMGLFSMMWDLGMAFGPFIGGTISSIYSMSLSFYLCSIMAFISGVLIVIRVKETATHVTSSETSVEREKLTPYKRILLGLCVGGFTTSFALGLTMTILSVYGNEMLGLSEALIGIIFGIRGITRFVVKPLVGDLSDIYGKRIFLITGRTISSLATASIIFAKRFLSLLTPVIVAAVGTGMAMPSNNALVTNIAYKETRGKVMGLFSTGRNLGLLVGPLLGGWVYDNISPQTPFVLCGAVGMIGVLILYLLVHDTEEIE
jgi:MFS family permease